MGISDHERRRHVCFPLIADLSQFFVLQPPQEYMIIGAIFFAGLGKTPNYSELRQWESENMTIYTFRILIFRDKKEAQRLKFPKLPNAFRFPA
jgi:hypothetical protein